MGCAAGIYIADDSIVFGAVRRSEARSETPSIADNAFWQQTRATTGDLKQDLITAIAAIADETVKRGEGPVDDLALALPGPVKVSGMRVSSTRVDGLINDYGTFGTSMRRSEFAGIQVGELVDEAVARMVSARGRQHKDLFKGRTLYVYHDAAAYAYGDFLVRRQRYCANGGHATHYNQSEIHATVLLDEGVGGGIIAAGVVAQGPTHAEMGHIYISKLPLDPYHSQCRGHFRNNCLEALVGLSALTARWGPEFLDDYSTWEEDEYYLHILAHYVHQLIVSLILTVAPTHISLTGRVATGNKWLIPKIADYVRRALKTNGPYPHIYPGYQQQADPNFIEPVTSNSTGIYGCVMLAHDAKSIAAIVKAPFPLKRS